jgi:hypothetical protein
VTVLCALFPAGICFGAETEKPETPWRLWGAVGGGFGSNGAAAMGELVFQKGSHQITARAVAEIDPYGEEDQIGEIGLLYGRTAMSRQGHASISAGVAVTGTDMDTQEMTLGVPIVGEAALRLFPFLGIGTQVFANLNSMDSYLGLALFMQFGYVRAGP